MASKDGRIDLHIHSTASDGTLTPQEILAAAKDLELRAIAITDHDTVDGTLNALESGIPEGLEFVPGVEISADIPSPFPSGGSLHILGYFIDPQEPELERALKVLQDARADRNPKIIRKLQSLGMDVTLAEAEEISGGGQVGRPHIAQALVKKGFVNTTREAFDYYLAKDQAAYVGKYRLSAQRAVELILKSGGLPVCAHPFSLEFSPDVLFDFLSQLKDWGLPGLEVYYPQHNPDMVARYFEMAQKLDLLITGGSDYHGASKPDIQMGTGKGDLFVPLELYDRLLAYHKETEAQAGCFEIPPGKDLGLLEEALGYNFKTPELLLEAMCHSSYVNEHPDCTWTHNERLEFLGDAVLNLAVSDMLMSKYSENREGDLSRLRASLVNEGQLAEIARSLGIGQHLLLGKGEARGRGWDKNSILADSLEAVFGGIYSDSGYADAFKVIKNLIAPLIPEEVAVAAAQDYKTRLQEYAQSKLRITPSYELIREFGPDHEKTFVAQATVNKEFTSQGKGRSKKAAEQDAAREVLILLGQEDPS
ncbi:Ribonuclease III [Desulfatibacillum aliphaticivorans]|uniref:Ribonuclease 3 n=1 Tax=Desulfatibacillum aliphaticivorans TaxID=218208 RepID=B8FKR2_DESAL|nr:ribonuclease III [Desulfatibacillum aliphaticivorans]ACL04434.1 Ribonuclease III [Desulfatibacillum aliphaticivorans]